LKKYIIFLYNIYWVYSEVLLNNCQQNHITMIVEKDNNITKWIKLYHASSAANTNTIFRWLDKNWREISYWNNNGSSNINNDNEFETLTFSNHHNNYQDIQKYAKWWVIDGWNWNTRSSYNNENGNLWWGNMNNSNDLICAAYR